MKFIQIQAIATGRFNDVEVYGLTDEGRVYRHQVGWSELPNPSLEEQVAIIERLASAYKEEK